MKRRSCFVLALGLIAGCRAVSVASPPAQPQSGPGGADYSHRAVLTQHFGEGAEEYWLFQPDEPRPTDAPVVVFLHGWGGTDPKVYGAWIEHIVRKGRIVIYPLFQATLRATGDEMMSASLSAVRDAIDRLGRDGPVRPRLERIAWVGHSLGGILGANLAANYSVNGLPPPAVLMAVTPGGERRLAVAGLAGMPTDALVLLVVGDADRAVAGRGARALRTALAHMPAGNLEEVTLRSDKHSSPSLAANHLSPLSTVANFPPSDSTGGSGGGGTGLLAGRFGAPNSSQFAPDALDYYGYWKLLDGLLDAAFLGRNREYALGGTVQQRFMGVASDGVPVVPLEVAAPLQSGSP